MPRSIRTGYASSDEVIREALEEVTAVRSTAIAPG